MVVIKGKVKFLSTETNTTLHKFFFTFKPGIATSVAVELSP
jgi:hypothetical protein